VHVTRALALAIVSAALLSTLATADPAVTVRYEPGAAIVRLEGDYANQWYAVSRADAPPGPWLALTDASVLCLGECSVTDDRAVAGRTYWYRFDLQLADGSFTTYGPYPVTISDEVTRRVRLAVTPQPVREGARVEVWLAGRPGEPPVEVRLGLFDLQGRRVAMVHEGALPRGRSSLALAGADDGRALPPGLYLLRLESSLGVATARVIRSR
jgi:hypothetical protein